MYIIHLYIQIYNIRELNKYNSKSFHFLSNNLSVKNIKQIITVKTWKTNLLPLIKIDNYNTHTY